MPPEPTVATDQKTIDQIEKDAKERADRAAADATAKEKARCADIQKYWYRHRDVVAEFIRDKAINEGMSIEEFRGIVLDKITASGSGRPLDTPVGVIGMSDGEARRFSILKAIRAAEAHNWKDAGFEKECSDQVAKQVGAEPRAFYLPYDVLTVRRDGMLPRGGRRDMNITTDTAGGYLVGTQLMPGSFIELLRARLIAARAGVNIMSGLVGNVAIPKQTGAATGYWIDTEGNPPTESQPTVGQVTLSPKNVAAWVDITRNLMKQATPAADALVLNDIVAVLARSIDLAVFHGTGANGQPTGIPGVSGVGSFTAAAITRVYALGAITDVMAANADVAGMNWVTTPAGWGVLKGREQGTAGYPIYLCGDDDRMLGYSVLVCSQITAGYLFFGDFTQAVVGEWGVLDMNVDDKSLSTSGGLRIVGYQSVDVAVRQGAAFSIGTSLS